MRRTRRHHLRYGILDHSVQATRIYYDKQVYPDGGIVEIVIWRLPGKGPDYPHGLKYRLYYGRDGKRIVGYDNERGKGDHKHRRNRESRYEFVDVATLIQDFEFDVNQARRTT